MMRHLIVIAVLLIPDVAVAQALIARPAAEDCSVASVAADDRVTVNWPCVEVYAAKRDWQDEGLRSMALVLKAVRDQTIQENLPHTSGNPLRPHKDRR